MLVGCICVGASAIICNSGIVSGFRVAFGIVVRVHGLEAVMVGRLVGALYAVAVDSNMLKL
jgi:hypothetical protein